MVYLMHLLDLNVARRDSRSASDKYTRIIETTESKT